MFRKLKLVYIVESEDESISEYDEVKIVDLNFDDEINVVMVRKFLK